MKVRSPRIHDMPEPAWMSWFEAFLAEHKGRVSEMKPDMRLAFMAGASWGIETLQRQAQLRDPIKARLEVLRLLEAMRWEGVFHHLRTEAHDTELEIARNTGFW